MPPLDFIKTNPVTNTIRRNRQDELQQATGALALQNVAQGMESRRRAAEQADIEEETNRLRLKEYGTEQPTVVPQVQVAPEQAIAAPEDGVEALAGVVAEPVAPGPTAPAASVAPMGAKALTGFDASRGRLQREAAIVAGRHGAGRLAPDIINRMSVLEREERAHGTEKRKSEDAHVTNAMNLIVKKQWAASEQYAKATGVYDRLAALFTDPKARYGAESVVDQAKQMGLDDLNALTFLNGVMKNIDNGMPWEQAVQVGTNAAIEQAKKKPVGGPIETNTGIYERTQGSGTQPIVGPDGKILMPTNRRMFLGTGRGGGGKLPHVSRTITGRDGSVSVVMSDGSTKRLLSPDGKPLLARDASGPRLAIAIGKMYQGYDPSDPAMMTPAEALRLGRDEAARLTGEQSAQPSPGGTPATGRPNPNDPLGIRR